MNKNIIRVRIVVSLLIFSYYFFSLYLASSIWKDIYKHNSPLLDKLGITYSKTEFTISPLKFGIKIA